MKTGTCTASFESGVCGKPLLCRGVCAAHYRQIRLGQELKPLRKINPARLNCSVTGCERVSCSKGLCKMHSSRVERTGELGPPGSIKRSTLARDENGRKQCRTCDEWKAEDEYSKGVRSLDGLNRHCRKCKRREYLKDKYGVTLEWFDSRLGENKGCPLCGISDVQDERDWHVDHDHSCCPGDKSCGECVRDVLCRGCNQALGSVRDNLETLQNMVEYLSRFEKKEG